MCVCNKAWPIHFLTTMVTAMTIDDNDRYPVRLRCSLRGSLVLIVVLLGTCASAVAGVKGLNLPPTQGTSGTGSFQPGVYNYGYSTRLIHNMYPGFNGIRLPVNVATANSPVALAKLKSYVDHFPGQIVIICMFDTLTGSQTGHGDGRPNDIDAMGAAWAKINAVFRNYSNVHYEIFNEPFGYSKSHPRAYVDDIKAIIVKGGLPARKCILDGMGYASQINLVVKGGWKGDLAYHFYPNWSATHTQSAFSNRVQADLQRWGRRTWITEFGANLRWKGSSGYANTCYNTHVGGSEPYSADVNALRGLDDALRALRAKGEGIKGAFAWHGWHNNDRYDVWSPLNAQGACKVRKIEAND